MFKPRTGTKTDRQTERHARTPKNCICCSSCIRDRQTDTDRQRQRQTETDRQTDRQRETETDTEREADRGSRREHAMTTTTQGSVEQ